MTSVLNSAAYLAASNDVPRIKPVYLRYLVCSSLCADRLTYFFHNNTARLTNCDLRISLAGKVWRICQGRASGPKPKPEVEPMAVTDDSEELEMPLM